MSSIGKAAVVFLSLITAGAAGNAQGTSMSDKTILGTIHDPRIQGCGVEIAIRDWIELVPFIKATWDFAGSYEIDVRKISKSGTALSRQGSPVRSGGPAPSRIRFDSASRIEIRMNVMADDGKIACQLTETLDFPDRPQSL